jgi:superfamily I DNA and RNA helicase
MDRIKEDGRLLTMDPPHQGKPKIPISCGVVFPNINKDQYCLRKLDRVIDADKAFFRDHLHAESDIACDASGLCFRKALLEMFPPLFRFRITGPEYHHLKQLLFPVVRIEQPERNACAYLDPTQRVTVLDDEQEAIARKCCGGHHLVVGPSGSGKTLILAHKAAFLRQYNPAIQDILFVCFNITLVNYIKRLLTEKGVGLGRGGVQVLHFFELCAEILGEEIHYEKEEGEYYELVVEETLARLKGKGLKYDAVLVDEGQDFTEKMRAVVLALLDEDKQNLTVALDEAQNIYSRNLLWEEGAEGKPVRVDRLSVNYRNTAELRDFSGKFRGAAHVSDPSSLYCETHGPRPQLKQVADLKQAADHVAETIKGLWDLQEYPLSEMAVLYARTSAGEDHGPSIPRLLSTALESRGTMSTWMSEDYRAKRSYDITTESVTVSTIHSAKGLDYACVFLVGLDLLQTDGWSKEQIKSLVHVAITRARHRLLIPYVTETEIISELHYCL